MTLSYQWATCFSRTALDKRCNNFKFEAKRVFGSREDRTEKDQHRCWLVIEACLLDHVKICFLNSGMIYLAFISHGSICMYALNTFSNETSRGDVGCKINQR